MIPADRKYTATHEWVKVEGPLVVIGITDYAQDSLGDITFVELPNTGTSVKKQGECGVVESVKAASDLYSPISGEIAEINESLETSPEDINTDPYGKGWIFKLKNFKTEEVNALMDAAAYEKSLENQE